MKTSALAVLSIVLSVAAQFALKAGMSSIGARGLLVPPFTLRSAAVVLTNALVLGGLVLYGLGAVAWLGVLAKWDVSKAYPLVGLGFVMTLPLGLLAGEQVTTVRIAGVLLICAGVWLIART